ncbi:hypothetical protein GSI_09979 [Ganoderma sinense ZZ0214-1]|uniref:Uncharacterized protein n=1 Tax=Ganoderma sinense ZZ0214-1 TaxID=1077348 RepID=A0A2G8S2H1_9APHY|nr:hypothetical protein GSI_09979 [Ganoderma sinense ZZ0214-1]
MARVRERPPPLGRIRPLLACERAQAQWSQAARLRPGDLGRGGTGRGERMEGRRGRGPRDRSWRPRWRQNAQHLRARVRDPRRAPAGWHRAPRARRRGHGERHPLSRRVPHPSGETIVDDVEAGVDHATVQARWKTAMGAGAARYMVVFAGQGLAIMDGIKPIKIGRDGGAACRSREAAAKGSLLAPRQ